MKSSINHIQFNIDFENSIFYRELFTFLGWSLIFEAHGMMGFKSGKNGDVWFINSMKQEQTDYDKIGMNHISIGVKEQLNVDEVVSFLATKNVKCLFETPRHRPEFSQGTDQTYYQVMFTSPDNILFEVVYVGKKMAAEVN
jgi:catechol 2,3-dioxygenase-like lactoylglutathione lyase family enzyme